MALIPVFLVSGFVGWVIENALFGPRYSGALGAQRVRVPFLPVYGFGGVLLAVVSPGLAAAGVGMIGRAIVYSVVLSELEQVACAMDRSIGSRSWDYGDGACVDVPHAAAWGVLGLLGERVIR